MGAERSCGSYSGISRCCVRKAETSKEALDVAVTMFCSKDVGLAGQAVFLGTGVLKQLE